MKKLIQCFMVASIFVACNSKSDLDANKNMIVTDTTGMYKSNILTDTGSVIQTTSLAPNKNTAVANRPVTYTNRTTTTTVPRTTTRRTYNNSNSGQTTTVTRKRGWSKAAKDATIGGVGGAVVGAVVSKHKGTGAVVGGVLGAAGGYILGRSKDKKDGRY